MKFVLQSVLLPGARHGRSLSTALVVYFVDGFTGIFYAVVRQISMLFTDNNSSVFCILYTVDVYLALSADRDFHCSLFPFLV